MDINLNAFSDREIVECARRAFDNLDDNDRAVIRRQIKAICRNMHLREGNIKVRFGEESALILLLCFGVAICNNTVRMVK